MKVKIRDLAIKPAIHGVGMLAAQPLQQAVGGFLPGLAGTAVSVGVGYLATQGNGVIRSVGQGVLAAIAAGLLSPLISPMIGRYGPHQGGADV